MLTIRVSDAHTSEELGVVKVSGDDVSGPDDYRWAAERGSRLANLIGRDGTLEDRCRKLYAKPYSNGYLLVTAEDAGQQLVGRVAKHLKGQHDQEKHDPTKGLQAGDIAYEPQTGERVRILEVRFGTDAKVRYLSANNREIDKPFWVPVSELEEKRPRVVKHLRGEHDQQKHDPTKKGTKGMKYETAVKEARQRGWTLRRAATPREARLSGAFIAERRNAEGIREDRVSGSLTTVMRRITR